MARSWTWAAVAGLSLLTAGCGTALPFRALSCGEVRPLPPVQADNGMASVTLSVLTYNIEGLGWPARNGRAESLAKIGQHIAALRAAGSAPDVVMFQEMFSGAAKKAVLATGYPAIVSGPPRTEKSDTPRQARLPGHSNLRRGETGFHLTGSGLAIASRYPILYAERHSYGKRSCAGFDCLSNKGILLARIAIPGVPTPVDLYNTHMNSRLASRAPHARNLAAHQRQALEASRFIDETDNDKIPMIFGGDFNMRAAQDRWDNFTRYQPMTLVHRVCREPASGCDVRMSWDGDEPWMDTQDLQFFAGSETVTVRPIRVEALFDGGPAGPQLSDHDGFMVTYRLSWPKDGAVPPPC